MARKPPPHTSVAELYSTPVTRYGILTTLIAICLFNLFSLSHGLRTFIVGYVPAIWQLHGGTQKWRTPAHRAALFFLWNAVPLITLSLSTVDLHKRYRHTLSPKRVVISGSIASFLWALDEIFWIECVFFSWRDYIAYARPLLNTVSFYIPPLVLLFLLIYTAYITFGAIAWYEQRKAQQGELDNFQLDDIREYGTSREGKPPTPTFITADTIFDRSHSTPRSNQSIELIEPSTGPPGSSARDSASSNHSIPTPNLTTPETVSDRLPSTLQSQSGSAEPSTAPPSYSARSYSARNSAASSHSSSGSSVDQ